MSDSSEAREWARRVAATVDCPRCGRKVGQLCQSFISHTELTDPHPSRVAAGVGAAKRER